MTFNFGVHIGGYSKRINTEDGPVETWIETFSVQAVSPRGDVFVLDGSDSESERIANVLLATLDHTPASRPDLWLRGEPVYGSDAWDGEAEYSLACFEADAYNEPRPRW